MSNWEKISSDEMEIGLKIATLKKGELQIKYAKDIVEKNKEIERLNNIISKAIEFVKEKARNNCWIDQYEACDLIKILKGSDKE